MVKNAPTTLIFLLLFATWKFLCACLCTSQSASCHPLVFVNKTNCCVTRTNEGRTIHVFSTHSLLACKLTKKHANKQSKIHSTNRSAGTQPGCHHQTVTRSIAQGVIGLWHGPVSLSTLIMTRMPNAKPYGAGSHWILPLPLRNNPHLMWIDTKPRTRKDLFRISELLLVGQLPTILTMKVFQWVMTPTVPFLLG